MLETDGQMDKLTDLKTSTVHLIYAFPNSKARKTALFPRFNECVTDGRTDGHTDI